MGRSLTNGKVTRSKSFLLKILQSLTCPCAHVPLCLKLNFYSFLFFASLPHEPISSTMISFWVVTDCRQFPSMTYEVQAIWFHVIFSCVLLQTIFSFAFPLLRKKGKMNMKVQTWYGEVVITFYVQNWGNSKKNYRKRCWNGAERLWRIFPCSLLCRFVCHSINYFRSVIWHFVLLYCQPITLAALQQVANVILHSFFSLFIMPIFVPYLSWEEQERLPQTNLGFSKVTQSNWNKVNRSFTGGFVQFALSP